jgi:hypothetical protein
MSDAAERLAQALHDLINEAVREAVARHLPGPPAAQAVEHPQLPADRFDLCHWCNEKHMPHLMPAKEARHQLGASAPPRSTRWSRTANCRSLRSVAARSSMRNTSAISSGESFVALLAERELPTTSGRPRTVALSSSTWSVPTLRHHGMQRLEPCPHFAHTCS